MQFVEHLLYYPSNRDRDSVVLFEGRTLCTALVDGSLAVCPRLLFRHPLFYRVGRRNEVNSGDSNHRRRAT